MIEVHMRIDAPMTPHAAWFVALSFLRAAHMPTTASAVQWTRHGCVMYTADRFNNRRALGVGHRLPWPDRLAANPVLSVQSAGVKAGAQFDVTASLTPLRLAKP